MNCINATVMCISSENKIENWGDSGSIGILTAKKSNDTYVIDNCSITLQLNIISSKDPDNPSILDSHGKLDVEVLLEKYIGGSGVYFGTELMKFDIDTDELYRNNKVWTYGIPNANIIKYKNIEGLELNYYGLGEYLIIIKVKDSLDDKFHVQSTFGVKIVEN